jgi:hypothetical protein
MIIINYNDGNDNADNDNNHDDNDMIMIIIIVIIIMMMAGVLYFCLGGIIFLDHQGRRRAGDLLPPDAADGLLHLPQL